MSGEDCVDMEYRELNNHIRECWKNISDLLRTLLFIQILLISLIFLGGNVARVEGAPLSLGSSQTSSDPIASSPSIDHAEKAEADAVRGIRKVAILMLVFIGMAGSIGAAGQNRRLFWNATNFVGRAAFIESNKFLKDDRGLTLGGTSPPNTYLSDKLYRSGRGRGFDYLNFLLTATYLVFAPLWIYYAIALGRLYLNP